VERYVRYRAPAESGRKLVAPPWEELEALVAESRLGPAGADVRIAGRTLTELAEAGRRELIEAATRYVADYAGTGVCSADPAAPLILTGHQPGLVHPGVWLKNFVAGRLADAQGSTAVHVIIDGDLCRTATTLAPGGDVAKPHLTPIAYDDAAAPLPWEERRIIDARRWEGFPEQVHEHAPLVRDPFLAAWWPVVIERGRVDGRLGASMAQARHLTEIAWGRRNLELPQSWLCQTPTFRWFVCSLLDDLPRFVAVHNEALADYRRRHKLRNHAHPAPDLASDADWIEAPLWIWSTDAPQRRPVYVRRDQRRLTLSNRRGLERTLPLEMGADPSDAVAELAAWEAEGVKLRSRALVTTMYARLVLADLFIHGIGGAKYDEATDAICAKYFRVTPPPFAAVSGTLHLPIDHPPGDERTVRALQRTLRELHFNPDRHLPWDSLAPADRLRAEALMAGKRSMFQAEDIAPAERHATIVAANKSLAPMVESHRRQTQDALATAVARSQAIRVLESRDYAFCLYPEQALEQFLLDFR